MFHSDRQWQLGMVESVDELVEKLVDYSWTVCTGFVLGDTVWLNDSTGADGAQEYAPLKRQVDGSYRQAESYTVGWCDNPESRGRLARFASELVAADPADVEYFFKWQGDIPVHGGGYHSCCA